jgi:hypothetical protein
VTNKTSEDDLAEVVCFAELELDETGNPVAISTNDRWFNNCLIDILLISGHLISGPLISGH